MGDNDEGHAECAVQFQKQFGDGIAGPLVQVAGRLVGQQHAGLQQDGPRNGGALTLAAGKDAAILAAMVLACTLSCTR